MRLVTLKISTKIALAFGAMILLISILGGVGLTMLKKVNGATENIVENNMVSLNLAAELAELINEVRRVEARHVMADSDQLKSEQEQRIVASLKKIAGLEEQAVAVFTTEPEIKAWGDFKRHVAAWEEVSKKTLALSTQGASDQAKDMYNKDGFTAFSNVFDDLQNLKVTNIKIADDSAAEARSLYTSATFTTISIIAAAALFAVALGFLISRSISVPINKAVALSREIAAGNMTVELTAVGNNETAQLLRSLDEMRRGLAKVVASVREGSDSVASASAQIATGNQDLSSRTERQASSLEETSASMEELSSQVKHNAENAQQANALANSASDVAVRGGEVVGRVVQTMKDINDSSHKISDIISVIDGIAFQTNILALNAAVEAARAGEQGRGFAVVASEVRALAGRSAEAAKEIKNLISASVERVAHGTELVDSAGTTMAEVVASINKVSDLIKDINTASREQALEVDQIGLAINHMDQATQQNAALVEEMAAAAAALKTQAIDLVGSVTIFKLDEALYGNGNSSTKLLNN